jgi:hypothetical protein
MAAFDAFGQINLRFVADGSATMRDIIIDLGDQAGLTVDELDDLEKQTLAWVTAAQKGAEAQEEMTASMRAQQDAV